MEAGAGAALVGMDSVWEELLKAEVEEVLQEQLTVVVVEEALMVSQRMMPEGEAAEARAVLRLVKLLRVQKASETSVEEEASFR